MMAMDLGETIKSLIEHEKKRVVIYTVSFGTFLADRFLHFYPTLADSIIQDGVCPPGGICDYYTLNKDTEDVFYEFMRICDEDSFCSSKLNGSEAFYRKLLLKVNNGWCSELKLAMLDVKALVGILLSYDAQSREWIVPFFVQTK
eukprot:TRINITY_DN9744_c0_g1_i1.p1 TRINITY_DN9744_c0_g1~~TRINITY_DN9744_c0_g1_i1.p1  ORF type:complete len:145 (-),score=14.10 TRINITY_DN9744_c0_g1_i1:123-557(-)